MRSMRCRLVHMQWPLLLLLVLLSTAAGSSIKSKNTTLPFADQFPSLSETQEMAHLSGLVYTFRHESDNYCDDYVNQDGVTCEWYFHANIGTQVLIVSNREKKYHAVLFAGTDDYRTSLEDVNIAKVSFGTEDGSISIPDEFEAKVHAGFNHAVFDDDLGKLILSRIHKLKGQHPLYKLYTSGHSLGAANSILMATALAEDGLKVKSINFGCPQTGNVEFRDFFNSTSPLKDRLAIWRVVLGWDLVPRLPEFFYHVGHTIQIWKESHRFYKKDSPNLVEAYYEHYGSPSAGYAGVPLGWHAKPYVWVPGALTSHFITNYLEHIEELVDADIWIDSFEGYAPIGYDDDQYEEPPDDWYRADQDDVSES